MVISGGGISSSKTIGSSISPSLAGAQRCFRDANISFRSIAAECNGEVVGAKGDDRASIEGWFNGNKDDKTSLRSL